jgi:hypothetical protein
MYHPKPVCKKTCFTCAWKKHDACEGRPSVPWLREHVWRGLRHTRSAMVSMMVDVRKGRTYGCILGFFCIATLECDAMTLVLKTLRSDQTLDLGGLGVWLLALTLGLNLTTNDKLADLYT